MHPVSVEGGSLRAQTSLLVMTADGWTQWQTSSLTGAKGGVKRRTTHEPAACPSRTRRACLQLFFFGKLVNLSAEWSYALVISSNPSKMLRSNELGAKY